VHGGGPTVGRASTASAIAAERERICLMPIVDVVDNEMREFDFT